MMEDDEYCTAEECDDEPCDHEHADIDILSGRMSCFCGFSKWLTSDEMKRESELQRKAYEDWEKLCEQELSCDDHR